jgi:hypothetical protein
MDLQSQKRGRTAVREHSLAEIRPFPYNLRSISSHVTGEKVGSVISTNQHPGDKMEIHRGT